MNARVLERRLLGVAFLLIPVLLIWLCVAIYDKSFSTVTLVTLRTGTAGHEMNPGADVKVRGVVVGEVREIRSNGAGATLTLALDPHQVHYIPAGVEAQLLPTTVFGARYVSLVPPAGTPAVGTPITAGAVIGEDRSQNAVELSALLNNTMNLLAALKPAELSATLNAMADALRGRGTELGDDFVQLGDYLKRLDPELPALAKNLRDLATFANNFSAAAPDLLNALSDLTVTGNTLVQERRQLAGLYSAAGNTADEYAAWVRGNGDNIIELANSGQASLDVLRRYAPEFPCTLKVMAGLVPVMDKVLGKGTNEPGAHATVVTVQSKGRYLPGQDAPRNTARGGAHCPSVPYTGAPGSVPENSVVNELAAAATGDDPANLPSWSSLLVGPVFRGTEVRVK